MPSRCTYVHVDSVTHVAAIAANAYFLFLANQCYATDYSYSYSYASYRQSIASLRRRSRLSTTLVGVGLCSYRSSSGSGTSCRSSSRSCSSGFRFRFTNDSDSTSAARSSTNVTSYTILNRHILAVRILTRDRYGELVTNLSSGRNLNNDFSELASFQSLQRNRSVSERHEYEVAVRNSRTLTLLYSRVHTFVFVIFQTVVQSNTNAAVC